MNEINNTHRTHTGTHTQTHTHTWFVGKTNVLWVGGEEKLQPPSPPPPKKHRFAHVQNMLKYPHTHSGTCVLTHTLHRDTGAHETKGTASGNSLGFWVVAFKNN